MKISDLANVRVGLVLSRKKAKFKQKGNEYKLLTLKSINNDGYINTSDLESFYSEELLGEEYKTQVGDVVIRLSEPNTAIHIDESNTGIIIPSIFAIVRFKSNDIIPEYFIWLFNSSFIKRQIRQFRVGSTIQILNVRTINGIKVNVIPKSKQKDIININKLYLKEKKLLKQLIQEKEIFYNETMKLVCNSKLNEKEKNI